MKHQRVCAIISVIALASSSLDAAPTAASNDLLISPAEQSHILGHLVELISCLVRNQDTPVKVKCYQKGSEELADGATGPPKEIVEVKVFNPIKEAPIFVTIEPDTLEDDGVCDANNASDNYVPTSTPAANSAEKAFPDFHDFKKFEEPNEPANSYFGRVPIFVDDHIDPEGKKYLNVDYLKPVDSEFNYVNYFKPSEEYTVKEPQKHCDDETLEEPLDSDEDFERIQNEDSECPNDLFLDDQLKGEQSAEIDPEKEFESLNPEHTTASEDQDEQIPDIDDYFATIPTDEEEISEPLSGGSEEPQIDIPVVENNGVLDDLPSDESNLKHDLPLDDYDHSGMDPLHEEPSDKTVSEELFGGSGETPTMSDLLGDEIPTDELRSQERKSLENEYLPADENQLKEVIPQVVDPPKTANAIVDPEPLESSGDDTPISRTEELKPSGEDGNGPQPVIDKDEPTQEKPTEESCNGHLTEGELDDPSNNAECEKLNQREISSSKELEEPKDAEYNELPEADESLDPDSSTEPDETLHKELNEDSFELSPKDSLSSEDFDYADDSSSSGNDSIEDYSNSSVFDREDEPVNHSGEEPIEDNNSLPSSDKHGNIERMIDSDHLKNSGDSTCLEEPCIPEDNETSVADSLTDVPKTEPASPDETEKEPEIKPELVTLDSLLLDDSDRNAPQQPLEETKENDIQQQPTEVNPEDEQVPDLQRDIPDDAIVSDGEDASDTSQEAVLPEPEVAKATPSNDIQVVPENMQLPTDVEDVIEAPVQEYSTDDPEQRVADEIELPNNGDTATSQSAQYVPEVKSARDIPQGETESPNSGESATSKAAQYVPKVEPAEDDPEDQTESPNSGGTTITTSPQYVPENKYVEDIPEGDIESPNNGETETSQSAQYIPEVQSARDISQDEIETPGSGETAPTPENESVQDMSEDEEESPSTGDTSITESAPDIPMEKESLNYLEPSSSPKRDSADESLDSLERHLLDDSDSSASSVEPSYELPSIAKLLNSFQQPQKQKNEQNNEVEVCTNKSKSSRRGPRLQFIPVINFDEIPSLSENQLRKLIFSIISQPPCYTNEIEG